MSAKKISLRQGIIWNTVGSLCYAGFNWLTTVLVVVLADGYSSSGSLAIAMAVGNVFATIALYKLWTVQVSDIHSQNTTGEYIGFRITSTIAAFIIISVYIFATVSPNDYLVVFLYQIFKAIESFVGVYHALDQTRNRLDIVGKSQIFRGILVFIGFVTGLMFFNSLAVAILLMSVFTLAEVIIYDARCSRKLDNLRPTINRHSFFQVLRKTTPGFLAALMCNLIVSVCRQLYGMEFGTELLGIFAAVATPAVIIQTIANYFYSPLITPIAEAWGSREIYKIKRLIKLFLAALAVGTALFILLFNEVGVWFYSLLYDETVASYNGMMPLILISVAMTALMLFLQDLLIVFNNYRGSVIAAGLSLITCLVLMNPIISSFGMNGISITISASYTVGSLVSLSIMRIGNSKVN